MADTFTPEQITQILEEFFKVVGTRKYIGERYVPIFGRKGEESIQWDNSAPYEPLTIVLYQGNSYTSRQYVPIGVEITNQDFWVITGNYNAQVEAYHRETITAREIADNAITTANNAITTANNAQTDIDTLLPKADFSAENTVKKYIDENPTRILTFDTVADMQAATYLKTGMTCHTNGFHAAGDSGAAYYKVSESGTANGMDVLALQGGLVATLIVTEPYVTPEQFGAWGDGTHDDTTTIQAALSKYKRVKGANSYNITSVNVTGCFLNLDTVDTCSIISYGIIATPCEVSVKYANSLTLGTFKNSKFDLGYIKTLNIAPANSFAYNKLTYERCDTLNIGVSGQSYWVNENEFDGRVINGIAFLGTYPHNCNHIYCLGGEGTSFYITSESDVHNNIIEIYGENISLGNISLNGYNNVITRRDDSYKNSNRNSLGSNIGGGFLVQNSNTFLNLLYESHIENLDQNTGLAISNYSDYENFLIEVAENETVFIMFDADKAAFRNALFAYDADMNPVDLTGIIDVPTDIANSMRQSTSNSNVATYTVSLSLNRISLPYKPEIKYWRFNVHNYTGGPFYFIDTKIYSTGKTSMVSKIGTISS